MNQKYKKFLLTPKKLQKIYLNTNGRTFTPGLLLKINGLYKSVLRKELICWRLSIFFFKINSHIKSSLYISFFCLRVRWLYKITYIYFDLIYVFYKWSYTKIKHKRIKKWVKKSLIIKSK